MVVELYDGDYNECGNDDILIETDGVDAIVDGMRKTLTRWKLQQPEACHKISWRADINSFSILRMPSRVSFGLELGFDCLFCHCRTEKMDV